MYDLRHRNESIDNFPPVSSAVKLLTSLNSDFLVPFVFLLRDGAALTAYLAWLEKNVPKGNVTEVSGAEKLLEFRQAMSHFVQISFDTISSSGPNSAVIHYHPTPETDRPITLGMVTR